MTETFHIGELARRARVPISSVRFYERRGLLQPVGRTEGGYRLYDREALDRLRFIRAARNQGFSLSDIQQLLALRSSQAAPCGEVQELIRRRLAEVETRIDDLLRVRRELERAEKVCRANAPKGRCEVLRSLLRPKE